MTGELKRMENGFLYFKADYMADTIQLDWKRVEELESKDTFSVVLSNGTRETGMIHKSPEANDTNEGFSVQSAGISTTARNYDVVVITPVQDTFLNQLTGSINYGFDFTGAVTPRNRLSQAMQCIALSDGQGSWRAVLCSAARTGHEIRAAIPWTLIITTIGPTTGL